MEPIPGLANRALWVLAVPTAGACWPWLAPEGDQVWLRWLFITAPMLGVVSLLGYRLLGQHPLRLWPIIPFITAALIFFAVGLGAGFVFDESAAVVWPFFISFVVQPFLALGGGLVTFVLIDVKPALTRPELSVCDAAKLTGHMPPVRDAGRRRICRRPTCLVRDIRRRVRQT